MGTMRSPTIVVVLLFSVCLVFWCSGTYDAHADVGTVYIRGDGSIDPPITELSSSDNVTYSLTGNLSSCIVIERNNIVLDGAGYTILGGGSGNGIELSGRDNVTIMNVEIRGFYQGILIFNLSSNNNVFGVRAIDNSYCGINVDSSTNNNVTGNMVVNGNEVLAQGILLANAEHNSVSRNHVEGNELYGLNLIFASNNLVDSNNVSNSGAEGILLWMSSYNNVICGNKVTQCRVGIEVSYSSNSNLILQNDFSMNNWSGVNIGFRIPESGPEQGGVANNSFIENSVTDNNVGIYLIYSRNNTILRNNVQGSNASIIVYGSYANIWDDGYPSGGNYWSDYNGTDADHDGIGDSEYSIDTNNVDHYPLMGMFNSYNVTYYTLPIVPHLCNVDVVSNSTISDFVAPIWLEHPEVIFLWFNVSGAEGSNGFCRVSFPTAMMNGTYHVLLNGTEIPYTLLPCSDANTSYLYFNYTHSTQEVIIIPEFPSFLILPAFLMATLLAVATYRRKHGELFKK